LRPGLHTKASRLRSPGTTRPPSAPPISFVPPRLIAALVEGRWLKPGACVDLVGAYAPHLREADDATVLGARVYVDTRPGTIGTGELTGPLGWAS
jgi:hypothetical protein